MIDILINGTLSDTSEKEVQLLLRSRRFRTLVRELQGLFDARSEYRNFDAVIFIEPHEDGLDHSESAVHVEDGKELGMQIGVFPDADDLLIDAALGNKGDFL